MATENELIASVNALPDTQAFYAQPNSITAIGTPLNDGSGAGDKGYVKTYTHFKTVDSTRVRENSVKIYVNPTGSAFFLGSDPAPQSPPSARVTPAQVLSFYPNAENITINRLDDSFDEVRFDNYDNTTKKAVKKLVRVKFAGGSYEKHYEVTNEYEQVA